MTKLFWVGVMIALTTLNMWLFFKHGGHWYNIAAALAAAFAAGWNTARFRERV